MKNALSVCFENLFPTFKHLILGNLDVKNQNGLVIHFLDIFSFFNVYLSKFF
jgi:hypothetical protein